MKLNIRALCALALFGAFATHSLSAADWKELPGHVPREVAKLTSTGQFRATNQMRLAIGLPLRDPAGLSNFLADIYNPASPNYRHYLTPGQVSDRFGPSAQDYETVKEFARTNGLTVTGSFANRLVLDVAGPAAAVEKAWHIKILTYQHPTEARKFFAPDANPTVQASLPVVDIQGLSDFARPHAKIQRTNLARRVAKGGSAPGGSGAFFADDFRNAYAAGTSLTGTGQIVGLLQFDGFYSNDIAAYATAAGGGRINIPIQTVLLDGYNGKPASQDGNMEVSLDIEMSMSMAPGLAKIVVFEAGPYGYPNDILNSMLSYSNTIRQLSCSWGWGGGPSATTEAIFQSMDAVGQTFFNASGDSDAFTMGADSVNGVDNPSLPNSPSSSPNITHVGGTTLTMNGSGSSYESETVWNWGIEYGSAYDGVGSSGGVSSYYPIPWWQTNVSNMAGRGGSASFRNTPDVAMTADNVYVIAGGNQSVDNVGGTSCASPLWAGFMALVNQQTVAMGGPSPGFINPALYAISANPAYGSCFHDVTTGNDTWSSSPDLFFAMSGYDLCTGLGTPDGAALINALGADTLGIIADSNDNFIGLYGGPFVSGSCVFELTNTTGAELDWSLANSAAWLSSDVTNGTLSAHSFANVTVCLTATASNLLAGSYAAPLLFSNSTTHAVHDISASLHIQDALSVCPARGFASVGPVGGPFPSASQAFVLTNLGGGTLNWIIVNTSVWLNVSQPVGSLPPSSSATVTVAASSAASTLSPADYEAFVLFADQNGAAVSAPFDLSVGQLMVNRGFEIGDFTGWIAAGTTNYLFVTNAACNFVHSGACGAVLGSTPAPGCLTQNVVTSPGATYVFSFWLRNPTGGSLHKSGPNFFQACWNGTLIFAQTNISSSAWTQYQFNVTATSTVTPLQFCFQDDPAYLALDDVSVIGPVSGAGTASVSSLAVKAPNSLQMTWNTTVGKVYQLQYKTNLCQPDWINLGNPVTACGGTLTLADTNQSPAFVQRFYRLAAQ